MKRVAFAKRHNGKLITVERDVTVISAHARTVNDDERLFEKSLLEAFEMLVHVVITRAALIVDLDLAIPDIKRTKLISAGHFLVGNSVPARDHIDVSFADRCHNMLAAIRLLDAVGIGLIALADRSALVGDEHLDSAPRVLDKRPTKLTVLVKHLQARAHSIEGIAKIFLLARKQIEVIGSVIFPRRPAVRRIHHIAADHNVVLCLPEAKRSTPHSRIGSHKLLKALMHRHKIFRRFDIGRSFLLREREREKSELKRRAGDHSVLKRMLALSADTLAKTAKIVHRASCGFVVLFIAFFKLFVRFCQLLFT